MKSWRRVLRKLDGNLFTEMCSDHPTLTGTQRTSAIQEYSSRLEFKHKNMCSALMEVRGVPCRVFFPINYYYFNQLDFLLLRLFAAVIGSGIQIFLMLAITIFFAMLGMLSPASRGALLTAAIFLYEFMGLVAGYYSGRLYKTIKGKEWKVN